LELPEPLELPEQQAQPPAEPAPRPRRARPEPPPAGWFSHAELAELLEIGGSTLSRWRQQGQAGSEGSDWRRCGKAYHYTPQLAEALMQRTQAAAAEPAPTMPPADAERWIGSAELGAWFGLSTPWVARARRLGWLREGEHYRKAQPGEFSADPHRSRGWVHDLGPCLAALAEASGRPVPDVPISDPREARRASQEAARLRAQSYRVARQEAS
jgi:hypothetical protein